jgi:hypothetical protein
LLCYSNAREFVVGIASAEKINERYCFCSMNRLQSAAKLLPRRGVIGTNEPFRLHITVAFALTAYPQGSPIGQRIKYQDPRRIRWEASMASSKLIELGQQSVAAVATSVARGAPLVQCQLLASEFYEALKDALRETPEADVTMRDTLLAASIQCLRAATATISPDRLLDELKSAIAVLQSDGLVSPPVSRRPMLRVIQGGLSRG